MGIFCQIFLNKPPDGVFYGGEVVSGMIKYALDEPMEIEKITISLKGIGYLERTERTVKTCTYTNNEVYVDTDDVIQQGKDNVPAGSYETKFKFRLPQNIPPSFKYLKHMIGDSVKCKIKYYVRIRFDRPRLFAMASHFRKEIIVAFTMTPRLPIVPIIYGERSKLLQLFSRKTSTVIMKAKILNSVIPRGGKIEIQSEIQNDTDVIVKSVTMKLIEVYTFRAVGTTDMKVYEDIPHCDTITPPIQCGGTQNMSIDIIVPLDKISLENSKIVTRDYVVRIMAELPMPHINVVLEIPVQIGGDVQRDEICDLPPTYWEAMGEATKDDYSSDDEACGNEKGEKS